MDNMEDEEDEFKVYKTRIATAIFVALIPLGIMLFFGW
jgi:hypothetical protein